MDDFDDVIEVEEATDADVAITYEDAMAKLETDKRGAYLPSAKNLGLIMKYDPNLKGLSPETYLKNAGLLHAYLYGAQRIVLWTSKMLTMQAYVNTSRTFTAYRIAQRLTML